MAIRSPHCLFMIFVTVIHNITLAGSKSPDIRVAAAANLRLVLPGWVQPFSEKTGIRVEVIYGSSGGLATQIRHGAPFDVFLSANVNFADSLIAWGKAKGPAQTYAYGQLALWSPQGKAVDSLLQCLGDQPSTSLALADTSHSPYGQLAYQALVRSGQTRHKNLVFGENLSQVMQFAQGRHADMALISLSLLVDAKQPPQGRWVQVASHLAPPLPQGLVVTRYGEKHAAPSSQAFIAFLLHPDRDSEWRKAGYLPGSAQPGVDPNSAVKVPANE